MGGRMLSESPAGSPRNTHPPLQKEAILRDDILDMIETLDYGLRDMRDRAILLIGYAGGLRRSEIVSLDFTRDDTEDGKGWITIEDAGAILTLTGKSGWREVEIGRGSSDATCPVHALEQYLHYAGRVASITGQARSTLTRENGQPTDSNLAQPSSVILLRARTPICASVF